MAGIPQPIHEVPLEQVIDMRPTSVRLSNAIRSAKAEGTLPFKTVGDYIGASSGAMDALLRIRNLGRKSAREFHDIIYDLAKNGCDYPAIQGNNQENSELKDALLAPEITLEDFVNKNPVSVRVQNAITEASRLGICPFNTVADYLKAGPERKKILREIPNLGNKSIDELDSSIKQSISMASLVRGQAGQRNLEINEDKGSYFSLAWQGLNKVLSEKEFKVIKDRLYYQRTLEEIAVDYGITRERVRQIEKRGLKNAQRALTGISKEIEVNLTNILANSQFSLSIGILAKEVFCDEDDLNFLLKVLSNTNQNINDILGIKDNHIYQKSKFLPEPSWETQIFRAFYSADWPTPLTELYATLSLIPPFFITSYLQNSLLAVIRDGQLVRLEKLRSSLMCIKVLMQEKRPMHLTEIRARLHELFDKDIDERAIGATLGRLREALIVEPGTYALYKYLPYTESDLKNISDEVFKFLSKKNLYISSKVIFDVLFGKRLSQFPYGFNDYIVLGIIQDDERFVTKRGNMIGLASFEVSNTFTSLEGEVHSIIDEHGPISIRQIMAMLSETRKLCNDSGVRQILDASSEIIRVGKSTYDNLYRLFENRLEYERLKLAIKIILMQHEKSAYALGKELSRIGFPAYALETLESILKTTEGVYEKVGTYFIESHDHTLNIYNNLVSHELSKGTHLERIKQLVANAIGSDLAEEYSSLDPRLVDAKGETTKDIRTDSEVTTILDQFGI